MKKNKIKEIIDVTKGTLIKGNINSECREFCKDTRIINPGDTYIGIKGENFDGNLLWKQAFEKGASTVIIQSVDFRKEELSGLEDRNIIEVEDTIKAIELIREELFANEKIKKQVISI